MDQKKSHVGISDVILLLLTAVFLIGIRSFFAPCGPKEDGTWMHCHEAENAVFILGIALFAVSAALFLVKEVRARRILSAVILVTSVITALVPNVLIHLCMMSGMRCLSVMRPAVIVISVLIAVGSAAELFLEKEEN